MSSIVAWSYEGVHLMFIILEFHYNKEFVT